MFNKSSLTSPACALLLASALSACSTPKPAPYQLEQFDSSISPYAHSFATTAAATCYAARRALLSQGYTASSGNPNTVDGSKNFQPSSDSHVVIEFHVVCTSDFASARNSTIYVNAVQDRYTLKKSTTSASVGLSVLGAISLPIGSSDDALVKISSETIPSGSFYERYFGLVQYYLNIAPEKEPLPEPETRQLEMVPTSKTGILLKDASAPQADAVSAAPAPDAASGAAVSIPAPASGSSVTPASANLAPPVPGTSASATDPASLTPEAILNGYTAAPQPTPTSRPQTPTVAPASAVTRAATPASAPAPASISPGQNTGSAR